MRVAVGCDHAGFSMKSNVISVLDELGIEYEDMGTSDEASCDYPDYGEKVSEAVSSGRADRGVLVCGSGIGMSIVANKFPGVRAALCHEDYSAKMSRLHNDSNVLVIAGRIIDGGTARKIVKTWCTTDFEGGRHQRRIEKSAAIGKRLCKGTLKN